MLPRIHLFSQKKMQDTYQYPCLTSRL